MILQMSIERQYRQDQVQSGDMVDRWVRYSHFAFGMKR